MPAVYPGPVNTYVQDHAASGGLVVDFSRNPTEFPLNRYTKLIPCKKMTGLWLEMTVEEAARILSTDDAEHDWPDAADAPDSNDGTESFQYKEFRTRRKAYTARLGNLTAEQASWDVVNQHSRIKAAQAMTARSTEVLTMLTTTANYNSGHYSAAADISENTGTWAQSTSSRQDIQRSLNYAAKLINKQTLGKVRKRDMVLVISPDVATEIAECQEIVEWLKTSPHSKGFLQGDLWDNSDWGLPGQLYGIPLVVEDTVRVTTRKGATTSKSYVLNDDKAILVSRPGAHEGMYGSPEFSSCSVFVYEKDDMSVYVKNDTDNELTKIRVKDNRVAKLTSPISSFLFTDVIS